MKIIKQTPKRLEHIFQSYDTPVYFVTFNTWQRNRCLATPEVHEALRTYALTNLPHGRCIGRYVIMPDHIHLFARLQRESRLSDFIRLMKQHLGKFIGGEKTRWQPGFFDHLLRHDESYAAKWEYVRMNPVRAGLVAKPEDWPFQGEVARIEW